MLLNNLTIKNVKMMPGCVQSKVWWTQTVNC